MSDVTCTLIVGLSVAIILAAATSTAPLRFLSRLAFAGAAGPMPRRRSHAPSAGNEPLAQAPNRRAWSLLLVGSEKVDGGRRLRLVGDDLRRFTPRTAERVSITALRRCAPLRRLCRVESFDPEALRLEVTLPVEGDAAAEAWASAAHIGDRVMAEPLAL